jgi:hypothetical protein
MGGASGECRLLVMLCICHFKNSAKCYRISHVPTSFVAQRLLYNHLDPAQNVFSLLIIPMTIGTDPLARLLLIYCWRCIVFLIIYDLERKGREYQAQECFYKNSPRF